MAGSLALLLPETLNKKLPETIEDGEKFGRYVKSYQASYFLFFLNNIVLSGFLQLHFWSVQ